MNVVQTSLKQFSISINDNDLREIDLHETQKEEFFSANTCSKWDTLLFLQILILTRKFH